MNEQVSIVSSPIGYIEIVETDIGVKSIKFVNSSAKQQEVKTETSLELCNYFNGKNKHLELSLDIQGTEFQKKVWREVRQIPYGTTISYIELARRLGSEKLVRAVASANARNPLPIVIPCHRVVGKDGSLTGYLGGLVKKKWLLTHEGSRLQTELF